MMSQSPLDADDIISAASCLLLPHVDVDDINNITIEL